MLIKKKERRRFLGPHACLYTCGYSLSWFQGCVKLSQYLHQLLDSVVFCLKDLQNFPVLVLSFLLLSSTAQIEQKSKIRGAGCHCNGIQKRVNWSTGLSECYSHSHLKIYLGWCNSDARLGDKTLQGRLDAVGEETGKIAFQPLSAFSKLIPQRVNREWWDITPVSRYQ